MNINTQLVKVELENKVRDENLNKPIITSELVLNENASKILKLAVLEARMQHSAMVDVQHLLLAILHDKMDNGAKQVLELNNMDYEDILSILHKPENDFQDGLELSDEDDEVDDGHNGKQDKGLLLILRPLIHAPSLQ